MTEIIDQDLEKETGGGPMTGEIDHIDQEIGQEEEGHQGLGIGQEVGGQGHEIDQEVEGQDLENDRGVGNQDLLEIQGLIDVLHIDPDQSQEVVLHPRLQAPVGSHQDVQAQSQSQGKHLSLFRSVLLTETRARLTGNIIIICSLDS